MTGDRSVVKSRSRSVEVDQTIEPRDELFHPVGVDPSWSESYYFYYFDPVLEVGGITRMGFRANDGWADYMHIVFLEGKRIVFCYERRDFSPGDTDLKVGGLRLTPGAPFDQWTIDFDGAGSDLADGKILTTPRKDRPDGWDVRNNVKMQVQFKRAGDPLYMYRTADRAHFEQVGTATGYIEVDGVRRELNGFSLRDKSWGPRPWTDTGKGATDAEPTNLADGPAAGLFTMWITSVINENLAFTLTMTKSPNGEPSSTGFLFKDGEYHQATQIEINTDFEEGTVFHTGNRLRATFENGHTLEVTGTVLALGPSKIPMPGGATLVNSAKTRFDLSTGETGIGSAEYWIAVKR